MDPIRLQKQLKDNNLDLHDFCKDLKNWGDEMKQKDEHLKLEKENAKNTEMNMKSKKQIAKETYHDSDSEELSDEFDENALELATAAKDKGNKFFKSGRFKEAIEAYSQAIEIHRYDPTFYCNRALCYNKLNEFNKAELDCTTALQLDKHYVKAYHRRAISREGLGYYKDAHEDLTYALLLEPKNKESIELLEKINRKLPNVNEYERPPSKFRQSKKKSNFINKGAGDGQAVKDKVVETLNKPPVVKETKDILINEVKTNNNVQIIEKSDTEINEVKTNKKVQIIEKSNTEINEVKTNKKVQIIEKSDTVINEVTSNKKVQIIQEKENKIVNIDTSIKWPMGDDVILVKPIPKSKHKSMVPLKKQIITTSNNIDIIKQNPVKIEDVPKVESNEIKPVIKHEEPIKLISYEDSILEKNKQFLNWDFSALMLDFNMLEHPIPKTSVQFYHTWKTLDDHMRLLYLLQINPIGYITLFKDNLDNKVFSEIIKIIRKQKNGGFECLFGFTRVNRFTTMVMFLNQTDLKYLGEHYELMKTSNKYTTDELNYLYLNKYFLK
ncbi:PREDICTED: RNA polymerase II-associated protein 3 [Nicrophorus vespilloides]|uniref:RNA polymerase II-associated protein 3 n=1 Tax=Nicrophorus vespilloides TaxID=110193 RepID=A0ABM1MST7_NICVS|nr:PREDICTED: RNA polymerase II-associated protein 3 [Nicrophorus vespilloides]